jgi:hypothetical protein
MEIRNEFSAVTLRRVAHGRGYRVQVTSSLTGTSALLDATVLEALTRLPAHELAGLVGLAMTYEHGTTSSELRDGESHTRDDPHPPGPPTA